MYDTYTLVLVASPSYQPNVSVFDKGNETLHLTH